MVWLVIVDRRRRRRSSLLALVVIVYNKLVRLRNRVENAWAQVDVQLRRRYDLIPNLVETVKGYAAHERETFEEVTRARTAAQQAQGVAQQAEAENVLTAAHRPAVRGRRGVPASSARARTSSSCSAAEETEKKIAVSRQVYNDTVLTYDNALADACRRTSSPACSASTPRSSSRSRTAAREAPRVQF